MLSEADIRQQGLATPNQKMGNQNETDLDSQSRVEKDNFLPNHCPGTPLKEIRLKREILHICAKLQQYKTLWRET